MKELNGYPHKMFYPSDHAEALKEWLGQKCDEGNFGFDEDILLGCERHYDNENPAWPSYVTLRMVHAQAERDLGEPVNHVTLGMVAKRSGLIIESHKKKVTENGRTKRLTFWKLAKPSAIGSWQDVEKSARLRKEKIYWEKRLAEAKQRYDEVLEELVQHTNDVAQRMGDPHG